MTVNIALQSVMKSVEGASYDGSTLSAIKYANALDQLTSAQQRAVMTALGLDAAAKQEILNKQKLLAVLSEVTVAQVADEIGINADTLASEINAKAQDHLTEAMLEQIFVRENLEKKQQDAIFKLLAERAAIKGTANEYAKAGNTMSGVFAMMKANPAMGITAAIGAITTVISLVVSVVNMVKQAQEEARQAAVEAAREYEQAAESIGDYKDRVLELKKSLDEGNLSQEEAYNARKELLSIQDEIREAYGKEAEAINLVPYHRPHSHQRGVAAIRL